MDICMAVVNMAYGGCSYSNHDSEIAVVFTAHGQPVEVLLYVESTGPQERPLNPDPRMEPWFERTHSWQLEIK